MSSRHIPWPSIENLGVSYGNAVKGRSSAITLAVLMLQRWWRWIRSVRSGTLDPRQSPFNCNLIDRGRPLTPLTVYRRIAGSVALYENTPCYVAEKYDGTNVGIASDGSGTLYGRRSMIECSTMSFQKAPLSTVRSIDTVPVKEAILSDLTESTRSCIRDIVFYGELMLGHDKFNYRPRGIKSGDWICFGAKIVLDDSLLVSVEDNQDDESDENSSSEASSSSSSSSSSSTLSDQIVESICSQLQNAGYAITTGLTMFMSPKLRQVIGDRFPTVRSIVVADSITSLVLDNPDIVTSLLASTCEGVVVTGRGGKFSLKWKSSKEEESQAAAILQQALDLTEQREFRASIAVSDRMVNAMQILRSIAAQLSAAPQATQKDTKTRVVKVDPLAQLQPELERAYASALTKFDAPEVYFAQGDKQLNEFTAMIAREVASDLEQNARNRSENPATPLEVAEKQRLEQAATLYVRRTIGKAYGAFKKANTKSK